MRNYREQFIVKPGAKIRLARIDPAFHGRHESHEKAKADLDRAIEKMDRLQTRMYAEHRHSILIVLQGLDAAGKDGVIRHVFTGMNPQGCAVATFKQPTPQERDHDFLWRVHPRAPARGHVTIFNRSHYEDVLVARVHRLVPKEVWAKRYSMINAFERTLAEDSGTTVLKFFLHISKNEQLARFEKRLDDPHRNWKISESDYEERKYWHDYMAAFEEVFRETSAKHAPWFVIPANHKWFSHLAISEIIVDAMERMRIKVPPPTVDLAKIRRQFHSVLKSEKRAH
ncbi:MAG TPA: polyphosphate kinase 2 family protein [Candidatus Binataceae bacterium]|nr:polyphosphate kinase 2 family protein [Candidatus Binataceae bacterium]